MAAKTGVLRALRGPVSGTALGGQSKSPGACPKAAGVAPGRAWLGRRSPVCMLQLCQCGSLFLRL